MLDSPQLHLTKCTVCGSTDIKSVVKTTSMMHDGSGEFNFDQCQECHTVFLNPRVPLKELGNYYTKYYLPHRGAEAWGKFGHFVEKDQKKTDDKRAELLKKHCAANAETTLLDLGCGKPSFLKTCQEKFNCKAYGIDFSDEGWRDNRSDYSSLNLSVGDVNSISPRLQPDVITMWHYLEHDYNPRKTLERLKELAKSTTKLVIEIPNYASESRKKYGSDWAGYHTPRHTYLFSHKNIEQLLNSTGWKLDYLDELGTLDPYNLYWMSQMEQKNIDWQKNMETEFWGYVRGMIGFNVKRFFNHKKSHGVMTLVASLK